MGIVWKDIAFKFTKANVFVLQVSPVFDMKKFHVLSSKAVEVLKT